MVIVLQIMLATPSLQDTVWLAYYTCMYMYMTITSSLNYRQFEHHGMGGVCVYEINKKACAGTLPPKRGGDV